MSGKLRAMAVELKSHAPFTLFGAATGLLCMFLFRNMSHGTSLNLFYIFHATHVVLSALVTAAMFRLHTKAAPFVLVIVIGLTGGLGVATVSDSLIPYLGELTLGMHISGHGHGHGAEAEAAADVADHEHEQEAELHEEHEGFAERAHIGFVERWYFVIPAAIVGVVIAMYKPRTHFPHAGHVLLSTWATSFHIIMAMGGHLTIGQALGSFGFLFLAVWLPCCVSDIIFPLLFIKCGDTCPSCHH